MGSLIPGLPDDMARECLLRVPYKSFPTAASVCRLWKKEVYSPAFHRLRKDSGLSRSVIVLAQALPPLVIGGGPVKKYLYMGDRLVLYEPNTSTWDKLPDIPFLSHGLPLYNKIASVGRSLVVIGGWDFHTWAVSNEVFVYDFSSAKWSMGAPMPGPKRLSFACAGDTDRKVFVAGGKDDENKALRSALAYDVASNRWAPMPDMARERDECKGLFRCGTFQVLSRHGSQSRGEYVTSSEVFDIAAWRWRPVEEGTLGTKGCPFKWEVGDTGEIYRIRGCHVDVRDGSTWREAAQLPNDLRKASYMVAWRGKERLVVIGKEQKHGGGAYAVYILEVGGGGGEKGSEAERWSRAETPVEYSRNVFAGCCMEI